MKRIAALPLVLLAPLRVSAAPPPPSTTPSAPVCSVPATVHVPSSFAQLGRGGSASVALLPGCDPATHPTPAPASASGGPRAATTTSPGTIETVAGGGIGDGGPARNAVLFLPGYPVFGPEGDLYVGTQERVVRIDSAGIGQTVAGTGTITGVSFAYYGDGGPATEATLGDGGPNGIAFDRQGDMYIADTSDGLIRRVDHATGIITTVAGGGQIGFYGVEGSDPRSAWLFGPQGLAVDAAGDVFFADSGFCTVREIKASDGKIYTFAGVPPGEALGARVTCGYSADGIPALGAQLNYPHDVKVDSTGNVFISDIGNSRIREVNSLGLISTVAGNGNASDSGDGGAATSAGVAYPWVISIDAGGQLYISEYFSDVIRRVDTHSGVITTFAGVENQWSGPSGDGGPATAALLDHPLGAVPTPSGSGVVIADFGNNQMRLVDSKGIISTIGGNGQPPRAVDQYGNQSYLGEGYAGDGLPARSASFSVPYAVAVDGAGDLYVSDSFNQRVREVNAATGVIRSVAGTGTAGNTGDGGPATSAAVNNPAGLAVDPRGRLYIASGDEVRRIEPDGTISRFAGSGTVGYTGDGGPATSAELGLVVGLAFDKQGNLYLGDAAENVVRRVDANGIITTVAGNGTPGFSGDGGAATAAKLATPEQVAVDAANAIYIADVSNGRIRKVAADGTITTIAGNGNAGYNGDGGAATSTALYYPTGVVVDTAGNVFISDSGNCLVREITAREATIHVVAGVPLSYTTTTPSAINCAFSGDHGPGTQAHLFYPLLMALDGSGNLLFADAANSRVRLLHSSAPPVAQAPEVPFTPALLLAAGGALALRSIRRRTR